MGRNKSFKTIVANFKMNFTAGEIHNYFEKLEEKLNDDFDMGFCVAVPFPFLYETYYLMGVLGMEHLVRTGAQDCSVFPHPGAYTGEVSAKMINSCEAKFVLIGHSERRKYFQENHVVLRKKIENALKAGLDVIYCVGETEAERKENRTFDVIENQLKEVLEGLEFKKQILFIAYEPVWAIGTGVNATPEQVKEVHAFIHNKIHKGSIKVKTKFPVQIIYGGSFNSRNAKELLSQPHVDGALVGTASLDPKEFISILSIARGFLKS